MENDPKFQCKNCEKIFKTSQGFDSHKRADNCSLIAIEFKCDKCDKIFPTQRELTRHLNRKTPCEKIIVNPMIFITSLQCPFCLKTYKTKWTLNHHITICKIRINPMIFITSLQCPFCLKTYKRKWTLNHHITKCKVRVNDIAT